jgi:hypothetical protein
VIVYCLAPYRRMKRGTDKDVCALELYSDELPHGYDFSCDCLLTFDSVVPKKGSEDATKGMLAILIQRSRPASSQFDGCAF